MRENTCSYEYFLDSHFFSEIDAPDVQKGRLHVTLSVKKNMEVFILSFHIEGFVTVTCDRCLDDLELPVCTDNMLKVKLGKNFSDEDDLVVVPEEEGSINVSWFIYEFIVLSLPMKHVHAFGKCNKGMMNILGKHSGTKSEVSLSKNADDEISGEEKEIDSRWNDLRKILNNN